ncbi:DDE_3 domain-containing protein [Trichonephila clavipes]|nr:DDE_3 domain-containing protein [Trichonephila clavipes]
MDWPGRCSDPIPIKHTWNGLGRAIATRTLSENQPTPENNEKIGLIASGPHKFPYFSNKIAVQGLYMCKRGLYPLFHPIFLFRFAIAISYHPILMSVTYDHACEL